MLDADPEAAAPWVVTGYVAGPSLQQAVADHGPLPEHTVRALGAGLAEALAAVHALGLVHRDVKPSNVLLTLDGPRLIDFGIARALDGTASLTSTGVAVGSPGYMSPEQVLGRGTGPATDVFSLGAVLAFAASGAPPFPGDNPAALYQVVHEEPELGGVPGGLRETVAACLARDPTARPAPAEVARQLAGTAGAAGLVRTGWLPGPVVEGVSRRAVELLELEADHDHGPHPSPAPYAGPYAGPGEPAGSPGAFGPPPTYGSTPPAYGSTPGAVPARDGGEPGRGRRRTAVLAAGVLAAATAGALFLLPGEGNGGGKPTTVPEAFLGTWRGQVRSATGLSNPTVTLTISEGGKGDEALRIVSELLGEECRAKGTVEEIADDRLTVTDESVGDSPEVLGVKVCTGNTSTVVLTLLGDDRLRYESRDAGAGNPAGELTRVD